MIRSITLIVTAVLVCACATNRTQAQPPVLPNCVFVPPKLWVDEYRLELNQKPPFCVEAGQTFAIEIKQPGNATFDPPAGAVVVHEKPGEPVVEIRGDNSANADEILVTVDQNAALHTEPSYWIEVDGVGKLDPRVRVIGSEERGRGLINAIDEFLLEEFDLDLAAVLVLYQGGPAPRE